MLLDLRYFLGYNLDEELPWHSTVSRTRQLLARDYFDDIFTYVLSLCKDAGMVSGRSQAIDSAFIKANASMDSLELKAPKEAEQEEEQEDEQQTVERQEKERQGLKISIARRPAKKDKASEKQRTITAREDELQEIASRQKKWSQGKRPWAGMKFSKFTSNKAHYSPVDPDARIAGKPRSCSLNTFRLIVLGSGIEV